MYIIAPHYFCVSASGISAQKVEHTTGNPYLNTDVFVCGLFAERLIDITQIDGRDAVSFDQLVVAGYLRGVMDVYYAFCNTPPCIRVGHYTYRPRDYERYISRVAG